MQLKILQQPTVERVRGNRRRVANDDELTTGPGQSDVHSPRVGQKADFAFGVRANQRNDDRLFLAALKAIDRIDFQPIRKLAAGRFTQQAHLRGVGRDDGDVAGRYASVQQGPNLANDQLGLGSRLPVPTLRRSRRQPCQ